MALNLLFNWSAQLFRHLSAVDSFNDVLGRQGGHVRAGIDRCRADVRKKNAVGKSKNFEKFYFELY